jgi:hypothetical protein
VPGDYKRTGPAAIPSPSQAEPAPTSTRDSLSHCPDCRCLCGCHRPPPELPVRIVIPRPGEPFYSAWLAEGRQMLPDPADLSVYTRAAALRAARSAPGEVAA